MANNDRVADVYFRRIDVAETQDACRDRIHWLCRQAGGPRVLDIGCSQGISAIILAREGHEVVGIDIEPQSLEAARELLAGEPAHVQERARFVLGDAFSADFEPDSVDTVIMGELLEHLASPERLLERVSEWLTEGGRVVASVPHGYHPYHDHKRSFYLGSLVELLSQRFSVLAVDVVAERFLCAVALKPPASQAPQLPDIGRLLEWERRSYANIEDVQRRHHADALTWQEKRKELEQRAANYREGIDNLKKGGDELRQQVRSAEAALKQEQSTRSDLAEELNEVQQLWKEATRHESELSRRLDAAQQAEKRLQRELQQQREAVKKAQSLSDGERERRQRAEAQLERLKNQAEYYQAELALREQGVRYRLGDAFVRAARPSLDTLKLPFRFVKLFFVGLKRVKQRRLEARLRQRGTGTGRSTAPATPVVKPTPTGTGDRISRGAQQVSPAPLGDLDAITTLAEPYSSTPPELRRRNDVCVAAVADEFSWRAWQYEAELYTFTPKTWRETLEARKPDLLLVESAWSGLNDSWYFQIRDLGKRGEVIKYYAIPDVVAWCRQHGVPTVFYNKEDPPNFDVFIEAAKQFDYIFTSDANCIPDYRKHVGHDRVFALPFAAQPRIHNPIMTGSRTGSVCFAGTWYNHRHFARHEDAHKILRPALDFDLHIFDRMAHSGNPNYRWPDEYLTAVRGALPYSQMLAAYKRYKVFLNINSVKNSPTMFARRVFELLACGTPVISSYSEGIEQLLGSDVVLMSDDEKTTRELLERVLGDDEYRERLALSGQRKVFGAHSYTNRLQSLLSAIGIDRRPVGRPLMTMIAAVATADEFAAAHEAYRSQTYENKRLVICATQSAATASADRITRGAQDVEIVTSDGAVWGRLLQEVACNCDEGFLVALNPEDYYGPQYLTDYANATLYVTEPAIGKASCYQAEQHGEAQTTNTGSEYRAVSAVCPWTLCLPRAQAIEAAHKLGAAQTPYEWWNRTMRQLTRVYSTDRFNYVQRSAGRARPGQTSIPGSRFVPFEPRELEAALA